MMGLERISRSIVHRPKVALLAMSAVAIGSLCVLPRLQYEQDVLYLFRTADTVQTKSFADENTVVVLVGSDDCLQPSIVNSVRRFNEDAAELVNVQRTISMDDARRPLRIGKLFLRVFPKEIDSSDVVKIRQYAAEHPFLHDHLISADHKWARIIVQIDSQIETDALHETVFKIKSVAKRSFENTGATVYVTGLPAVQWEIKQSLVRDQRLFISGGILAGFLLSYLIFRSWQSVLIVLAGPVVGAVATFGFMAVWGEAINPLNVVVIPMALTIALTDSVHLQMQIQRLRQSGMSQVDAIVQTMQEVGPACVLTSLTTMVGFGSLATAKLLTIQRFGIVCGVSVALSLLAVLVIVPALAMVLGRFNSSQTVGATQLKIDGVFGRIGRFAVDRRHLITAVSIVVMLAMMWASSLLKPRISMAEGLPLASDAQQAVAVADASFGGTLPLTIAASWDPKNPPEGPAILAATNEVAKLVEREALFATPLSFLDLIQSLPRQSASELKFVPGEYVKQFVDASKGQSFISTWVPDAGSDRLAPRLTWLDSQLDSLNKKNSDIQYSYNRRDFEPIHLGGTLIRDLAFSLLTAALLCTLIVAIGFRSWRLGLIALLPNCLPLLATACLMVFVGIPLQLTSVTVFAIALGVAVDDTIHVLRRYQLSGDGEPDSRVIEALVHVGRPICLTTVILVVGLSVVLLSRIPAMHQFGALFIASLFWALLGDLVLLPAMLRSWGK
ncbi:MAG: efflux RND transporter permease subunit [Pirellulaceae bacterium]